MVTCIFFAVGGVLPPSIWYRQFMGKMSLNLCCVTYGLMFPWRIILLVNGMSLWPPTDGACVAPDLKWSVMVEAGTRRDIGLKVSFQHYLSFNLIVEWNTFQILILYVVNELFMQLICGNYSGKSIFLVGYLGWICHVEFQYLQWSWSGKYQLFIVLVCVKRTFISLLLIICSFGPE